MRKAGVPFGISVTSTRKNVNALLTDEFYDYYFNKLGVTYMWQFQLMPIGRGKDCIELTVTPSERLLLFRKWEKLVKEDKYCIADFWNSGILSDGCLAYGREGGYLYIDWNGHIMPCVFVPYYVDNILDLYKKGKSLGDALNSDFFKRGRAWQKEYWLDHMKKPCNGLMPCSIRDNYKNFRENILTQNAKPENRDAKEALESKEYREYLEKFDDELKGLTQEIWDEEYLEKEEVLVKTR